MILSDQATLVHRVTTFEKKKVPFIAKNGVTAPGGEGAAASPKASNRTRGGSHLPSVLSEDWAFLKTLIRFFNNAARSITHALTHLRL